MRGLGLILILTGLLVPSAWGQAVTRGPYLQQQTDHSIIVRWRTDVATDSVVRYGTDNTSNKGGRRYTYQVCEVGTANCSAVESVVF
jgi:hypothetical protein